MGYGFLDIAATPSVKAAQAANGSAHHWAGFRGDRDFDRFTEAEAAFIAARDSFYMATVSETGWPYVQHRGGPPGFLRVLDERTLGFADYRGNRQYISLGNLQACDRASLILVDYPARRRLKLFGHIEARDLAGDAALAERLATPGYRGLTERAFVIRLAHFDWNCPKHITPRFTEPELEAALDPSASVSRPWRPRTKPCGLDSPAPNPKRTDHDHTDSDLSPAARRRRGGVLPRGGPEGRARAAAAARLPDRRPHVPRPDPAPGGPVPHHRARPAGLRQHGRAAPGSVRLHVRQSGGRHRRLHGSARPRPLHALHIRLRRPGRAAPRDGASRANHRHRHAERQRLPGGLQRRLGAVAGLLGRPDPRTSRGLPRLARARDDPAGPIPSRRRPVPRLARRVYARPRLSGAAGDGRDPTRPHPGYRSNVALYPAFQAYFRQHRPPLLAAWGRNDLHFLPAGAEAYRRDLPDAQVVLLDAGHFALETHAAEIAALVRAFMTRL